METVKTILSIIVSVLACFGIWRVMGDIRDIRDLVEEQNDMLDSQGDDETPGPVVQGKQ